MPSGFRARWHSSALKSGGNFELLSGDSFRKTIREVIDHCTTAVVLWSRKSVESSFVLDEVTYSQRLGKLCPVRIDDVGLPMGFGQLHAIDLSDWDGELSHHGFQGLVKALEERIGRRARLGVGLHVAEEPDIRCRTRGVQDSRDRRHGSGPSNVPGELSPNTVFATFVRDQIESVAAEAHKARGRRASGRAAPPDAVPGNTGAAAPLGTTGWKVILAGVAILALVGIGYAYYTDAQRKGQAIREQVEAARIAAEQRARQLEEQAAADRAARERAEKSQVESLQRLADQAERDRIAKAQAIAFNEAVLHRDVRLAVEAARKAARNSDAIAEKARTAAIAAENAAELARNGAVGTIHLTFEGGSYLGEGSGNTRNGYGVSIYREPSKYAGDRYAGQYRDNTRGGMGVYTFGKNANNLSNVLRREGEYSQNRSNGMGVVVLASGDRYAGPWRDGIRSGNAVFTFADGRRYEGGFAGDKRNGPGVLWSAEGQALSAGLWKDGELAKALAP